MAHVTAVHHIATATNDVDRFVGFYREAFDLEPLPGFPPAPANDDIKRTLPYLSISCSGRALQWPDFSLFRTGT